MSATNATPHASCSWLPSYRPCGTGNPAPGSVLPALRLVDAGMPQAPSSDVVAGCGLLTHTCRAVARNARWALARDDVGPALGGYLSVTKPGQTICRMPQWALARD